MNNILQRDVCQSASLPILMYNLGTPSSIYKLWSISCHSCWYTVQTCHSHSSYSPPSSTGIHNPGCFTIGATFTTWSSVLWACLSSAYGVECMQQSLVRSDFHTRSNNIVLSTFLREVLLDTVKFLKACISFSLEPLSVVFSFDEYTNNSVQIKNAFHEAFRSFNYDKYVNVWKFCGD